MQVLLFKYLRDYRMKFKIVINTQFYLFLQNNLKNLLSLYILFTYLSFLDT